jgi:hypothetical protein
VRIVLCIGFNPMVSRIKMDSPCQQATKETALRMKVQELAKEDVDGTGDHTAGHGSLCPRLAWGL